MIGAGVQASEHLGDSVVAAFVLGELGEHERGEVDAHIDGCPTCHELVGAWARGQGSTRGGAPAPTPVAVALQDAVPARGGAIGRYLVLERLGEGGMGVVLLAYDPELDRKVAIKLLRGVTTRDPERASERLRREAQAMARLSHRNVVTVFDVGVHEGHVFVAMEYVQGDTLAGHLAATKPSALRTVALFVEAARGLQAAHAAGIVHRDVKPTNVLVGEGGTRVVVTDFGLARRDHEPDGDRPPEATSGREGTQLTESGTLLGTPAYMSPEQYAGAAVDARSDQFSWCVALWQSLYGELPFAGRTAAELAAAVEAGIVRTPTRADVPERIRRALVRGLSPDPADRFVDMEALVHAIEPPVRSRGRVALGAAVMGALAVPLVLTQRDEAAAPCEGAERSLADAWDEADRDALRRSFVALAPGRGEAAADRVVARLDDYADAFVAGWRDACEASRVRNEQSPVTFDLRMACLDRKRRALDSIVGVWSALPDAAAVDRVAAAVEELPRLEPCADVAELQQAVPLPDDAATRERIASARDRLAQAFALQQAGRHPQALAVADEVETSIADVEHAPVRAETALRRGYVRANLGDPEAAPALWDAVGWAGAARDDATMLRAMALLVGVEGVRARKFEAAHAIVRAAEAVLLRLGDPPEMRSLVLEYEARVHEVQDEPERAQALHERALALREQAYGPASIEVAASLQGLGRVARRQARARDALAYWQRAQTILVAALGPVHPDVAGVEVNLGVAAHDLGDAVAAREHYERALAIDVEIFGPDSPQLAGDLQNLAIVLEEQGPPALALAYHARALELREREDPRSAATGRALHNRGVARELIGDEAGALADYERALIVQTAALGEGDADVARVRISLGNLQDALGHTKEAIATLGRARADLVAVLGEAHTEVAIADVGQGGALVSAGRHADAVPVLRRALAAFEAALPAEHPHIAATLDMLARALAPSAPAEALALAERARAIADHGAEPVLRARIEITTAILLGTGARAHELLASARARLAAGLPGTAKELAAAGCIDRAIARGTPLSRAGCGRIAGR